MSAKNWTECPRCEQLAKEKKAGLEARAKTAYGKMPQEKYERLLRAFRRPIKLENSLREDYEWEFHEGEFSINYRASCSDCGFSFQHVHKEMVPSLDHEGSKKT